MNGIILTDQSAEKEVQFAVLCFKIGEKVQFGEHPTVFLSVSPKSMFLEFFLCGGALNEGTKHCAIFRGNFPHEGKALNIQNLPYFWNMKTHVVFFFHSS